MLKSCIFIIKQDTKTKFKPDLIDLLPILKHIYTYRKNKKKSYSYHHLILLISKQYILPKIQIKKIRSHIIAWLLVLLLLLWNKGQSLHILILLVLLLKGTATPLMPSQASLSLNQRYQLPVFHFCSTREWSTGTNVSILKINNSMDFYNLWND